MTDLIEELRAGAELEEAYDADGIIRTGYQLSLRWRAAAEIEKLQFSADAAHQVADDLENEIERLRGLLRICMRRWIPFAEVELRASVMEAAHCDADGNIK